MTKKRIFLIDGNSFCYRAFYAIRSLTTSLGKPTNAVYGFYMMLGKIIQKDRPDYLAVSFDTPKPTFRHKMFDDYKVTRKPMPDDLITQFPIIKKMLAAMNIPVFEKEGYEADDVLASLAEKLTKDHGLEVYIVSGDKDMLQIVNANIKVCSTHQEGLIYDESRIKARYGVNAGQITDLLALMGDSIDNIPGVPGIGEKTATELINEYGSLENLIGNIGSLKGKRQELLKEYSKQAKLCKELATLERNIPIELDLDKLSLKEPDKEQLYRLFKELEFKKLLQGLVPESKEKRVDAESTADLNKLALSLANAGEFAFNLSDNEATFAWKDSFVFSIDRGSLKTEQKLKAILENPKIKKLMHDIKRHKIILNNDGINLEGGCFDTLLAAYLINPSRPDYEIGSLAIEYLDSSMEPTMAILKLAEIFQDLLKEQGLSDLYYNVEMKLCLVLAQMELAGINIDVKYLKELSHELGQRLKQIEKDIYEIAGEKFNINSPKQLGVILFEKLKLPAKKKTKTGFSTDVEVLEQLALVHALPASILEYRELTKLKSTYIDSLPELVNPDTGRIHTTFNQAGTQTGRLSSNNPNLQNIPIRTTLGKKIRKAFIAGSKNNLLLCADYSQIELRILAHICADTDLIEAFNHDRDIHSHTASLIFNVAQAQVTDTMRSAAKTVNFGINYGMSSWGLARELKISNDEAQSFIDAYFARYPKVKDYIDGQIKYARQHGFVKTLLNRIRYIPQINSKENGQRMLAERIAINTPIQGSASDLIKIAMINIYNKMTALDFSSRLVLQVHDELVFDAAKHEIVDLLKIVRHEMQTAIKLAVPIKVDFQAGPNWLEMEKL